MTAIETLARMYADQFIDRFASIEGHWTEPLVDPCRHPHQNISGNAYRGCNRSFLPIIATFREYRLPLWMTVAQMHDMSIWPKKGTSGVPVSFTDIYIRDKADGTRSRVSVEQYDKMSAEERNEKNLQKIFRTKWYKVFNISQTTFQETYPKTMAEIERLFGADDGRCISSEPLDRMVSEDGWLCPVRIDEGCTAAAYDRDNDVITMPPKFRFSDDRAFYGSLLREMARSTGSEMRLDRGIWSDLKGDLAMEALVSELSAASMGALLGLGVTMDAGSERFLKSWVESIDSSPQIIYDAVRESARAADCLGSVLGLDMAKGVDITRIMERQDAEKAEKSRRRQESRIARSLSDGTVKISGRNHGGRRI